MAIRTLAVEIVVGDFLATTKVIACVWTTLTIIDGVGYQFARC